MRFIHVYTPTILALTPPGTVPNIPTIRPIPRGLGTEV